MRTRNRLRYRIKLLLASSLYYSGLLHLILRWRLQHRGVVLLYHRVLSEAELAATFSSEAIIVSPATFERHLQFLRRHFTIVGLEEFREWLLNRRRFALPPCLITFDDGWKDNLTHACPVLKAQGLPAVIFLPTAYIGTGEPFWQERLSRLLYRLGQNPILRKHPVVARHALDDLFATQQSDLADRACTLARSFKNRNPQEVDTIVAEVAAVLAPLATADDRADVDTFLSWKDVQNLRPDGITFGSHTVTHRILTQIDSATVAEELAESKRTLEQRLGAPVRVLAYPNGNHDAGICQQAREAGYDLAFTTIPGLVSPGDDTMRLRRLNIHDGAHRHLPLFFTAVLGMF
jgi:peptidoglycan/xylan/chitin deacetylase (PgdA/CDA1 family)